MLVVIDLNPLAWGLRTVLEAQNKAKQTGSNQSNGTESDQRPETVVQGLDAMLTFINSFLLMTHGNQVAVVGVHPGGSGESCGSSMTHHLCIITFRVSISNVE